MNPQKLLSAVVFPLTNPGVLLALVVFSGLMLLVSLAGLLGIYLALAVIPALVRYQMVLLEACARGKEPEPPGPEFFTMVGNVWTLFPAIVLVAIAGIAYMASQSFGQSGMYTALTIAGFLYPAMLGVLAITHSPLQSLNPVALYRFITHAGCSYSVASIYLLVIALVLPYVADLGVFVGGLVEMFFVFSLHAVIGTIIEPAGIVDDIDIPEPLEPDEATIAESLEAVRASALTHAYGFITHDNRKGGFEHITEAIDDDPNPAEAWRWYFERMLQWEESHHALFFAQHYVRDMLAHNEDTQALKLVMRCRMMNEQFKPFAGDLPRLIEAAEAWGNDELATVLKRM